jgi:hypothetical protein
MQAAAAACRAVWTIGEGHSGRFMPRRWLQSSAQGFNQVSPGNPQNKRVRPEASGRIALGGGFPGLKPWAESSSPFGLWGAALRAGRRQPPPAVGKPWEDSEPQQKLVTYHLAFLDAQMTQAICNDTSSPDAKKDLHLS